MRFDGWLYIRMVLVVWTLLTIVFVVFGPKEAALGTSILAALCAISLWFHPGFRGL